MRRFGGLIVLLLTCITAGAQGINIQSKESDGAFPIVGRQGNASPIVYDAEHDHTVVGIVAHAVANDIQAITGQQPQVISNLSTLNFHPSTIVAGTIGQSAFIDALIADRRIDVSDIVGKWEAYTLQVIDHPQMLVIAGSTPRGTAYGLFELSRLIGVSPWTWWADVMPEPRSCLYATKGKLTVGEPSVKFRGLFINDEDWGLQPWAANQMDTDIKDIGPRTYERVFELMLRLRANLLWPAMHPCTKAFWFYDDNPELAKQYAIVLGSSHCEPMLRNNVFEWFNEGGNHDNYNFTTHPTEVINYWSKRVEQSREQDAIYTVGMRGVHDGAISGYRGAENIANGLSEIIATQRRLINEHIGDPAQVPQMFCPYKEVLGAYNTGLINLPEDITLCWVDDNHGYIRQFPTIAEQQRCGGNGIYYHLSYWGSPQDYLWLCSTSPSLISYELSRGYEQGIRRLWMINVGDIKPAEEELEFCMDLAWNVHQWNPTHAATYSREWAARTFGASFADDIGAIKQEYYRLAAAGKPEHIQFIKFTHQEMDRRIADYNALTVRVEKVKRRIPDRLQDAFFQLVEYPVRGAYLMNVKHFRAKQSLDYASAGMTKKALKAAAEARTTYDDIHALTITYNTVIAHGKWNGIMDSKPRDLATFHMPKVASETDVAAVTTTIEQKKTIQVAAADYVSASPTLTTVEGLGLEKQALTVWPMNLTKYSLENILLAPYAEYDIPVKKGVNDITVRCLPTFPLNSNYDLRYAISIDDEPVIVQSIKTAAQTPAWDVNVLRGWAGGTHRYESKKANTLRVRIYFMDPGLVLSDILCSHPSN